MPQQINQLTVSKLIKGLITEAGELTFPEEASVDELNCLLERDGSRRRRLGLEKLPTSGALTNATAPSENYSYFTWKNAGGTVGLDILVLQIGNIVSFFDLSATPLTDGEKSFFIDLADYAPYTATALSNINQYSQILSALVIANPFTETLVVNYDFSTDSISVDEIDFRIRDFEWQSDYDQLDRSVLASTVSDQRKYDTYNAGWLSGKGKAALTTYTSSSTTPGTGGLGGLVGSTVNTTPVLTPTPGQYYPPLTHPWFSGKDAAGNFSLAEWEKVGSGSTITGNGYFKLDFFNRDRALASGLPSLPIVEEKERFRSVQAFAGRMFYAGLGVSQNSGKVLYSQLVANTSKETIKNTLGQCLQQNDPTAEDFSDLLDTDGGVIEISDADNIKRIHAYNDSLFVFAENGVWQITGIDGRFSPTAYLVRKISNVGIDSINSLALVEDIPFWWSKFGIHTLSFNESNGFPVEQNLSIDTIQTFFDEVSTEAKSTVFADYDSFNKKIFWFYGDSAKRNNALILDIPLKAFYPWTVSGNATTYCIGSFYTTPIPTVSAEMAVTDNSLVAVTSSGGPVVINEIVGGDPTDTRLVMVYTYNGAIYFGQYSSITMTDFVGSLPTPLTYTSYFETGYNFIGDLTLKKNSPFITVYLRSTEEGFTGNETVGYTAINPSSLLVKSYWDFKTESTSSQQAYRVKPYSIVDSTNLSSNQQDRTVHATRLKMRGRGRSLRLRFESEEGKNFIFLGFGMIVAVNDKF